MGFTEMMLIGIVALIVIGPERLPGVARTAGKYFGRLKRFMTTVRADVEQELRADELRQILAQQQKELDTLKDSISDAGKELGEQADAVGKVGEDVAASLDDAAGDAQPAAENSEKQTGASAEAAAESTADTLDQPADEAPAAKAKS